VREAAAAAGAALALSGLALQTVGREIAEIFQWHAPPLHGGWREQVADAQKYRWKARHGADALVSHGLWSVSRHPNFAGEMVFHVGVMLAGIAGATSAAAALLSALAPSAFLGVMRGATRRLEERRTHPAALAHLGFHASDHLSLCTRTPPAAPNSCPQGHAHTHTHTHTHTHMLPHASCRRLLSRSGSCSSSSARRRSCVTAGARTCRAPRASSRCPRQCSLAPTRSLPRRERGRGGARRAAGAPHASRRGQVEERQEQETRGDEIAGILGITAGAGAVTAAVGLIGWLLVS